MDSKRSFAAKLNVCVWAALVMSLAMSLTSIFVTTHLGEIVRKSFGEFAKKRALASDADLQLSTMLSLERGVRLRTYMHDDATVRNYKASFDVAADQLKQDLVAFAAMPSKSEEKELSGSLLASIYSIIEDNRQIYELCQSNQMDQAGRLDADHFRPLIAKALEDGEHLVRLQTAEINAHAAQASSSIQWSWWLIIGTLILSLAANGTALMVARQFGRWMREQIASLGSGADQVATAASQISSSSQTLAENASRQAASLEETSASSEEVNAMAKRNTDSALSSAEIVQQAQARSTEVNRQLDDMVNAMQEIDQSSAKISRIIKVIDEIAFQTNILALNAAVEAARAGEAGMGFAVVADEVRNLAQRCAQAAQDTEQLIEASLRSSNGGKQKVESVAEAVRSMANDTASIRVRVEEISAGSQEQSKGMQLIAGTLAQIEQSTQSTAASAEESAAAAEELTSQSRALLDLVSQIQTMVGGGGGSKLHGSAPVMRQVPLSSRKTQTTGYLPPVKGNAHKPAIKTSLKASLTSNSFHEQRRELRPEEIRSAFPLEEDFKEF